MSIPWSERGSFIPYPRPVVPPTSDIQDAPLVSFCLNEDWAAYVLGCLKVLARPETWNADQAAIDSAVEQAMRIAFLLEDGCMTTEQFRQADNCLLERSIDGGVTWDTIFDASSCVDALISSGRYGQFGPVAPVIPVPPGECDTRRITIYANTPYQSPFLLSAGDTIQITVIQGVWSGTLNSFADTHCADGGFLDSFAQCGGSADPGHTGDPMPSENHMRLVMQLNGTWYDAYNASLTVPGGVTRQALTIQANDDILLDNVGYVILDLEICSSGIWTSTFDFTSSAYGSVWSIISGLGTYVGGVGYVGTFYDGNSQSAFYLESDFTSVRIFDVVATIDRVTGHGSNNIGHLEQYGPGSFSHIEETFATGAAIELHSAEDTYMTTLIVQANSGDVAGPVRYTRIVVRGVGSKPAGWP